MHTEHGTLSEEKTILGLFCIDYPPHKAEGIARGCRRECHELIHRPKCAQPAELQCRAALRECWVRKRGKEVLGALLARLTRSNIIVDHTFTPCELPAASHTQCADLRRQKSPGNEGLRRHLSLVTLAMAAPPSPSATGPPKNVRREPDGTIIDGPDGYAMVISPFGSGQACRRQLPCFFALDLIVSLSDAGLQRS